MAGKTTGGSGRCSFRARARLHLPARPQRRAASRPRARGRAAHSVAASCPGARRRRLPSAARPSELGARQDATVESGDKCGEGGRGGSARARLPPHPLPCAPPARGAASGAGLPRQPNHRGGQLLIPRGTRVMGMGGWARGLRGRMRGEPLTPAARLCGFAPRGAAGASSGSAQQGWGGTAPDTDIHLRRQTKQVGNLAPARTRAQQTRSPASAMNPRLSCKRIKTCGRDRSHCPDWRNEHTNISLCPRTLSCQAAVPVPADPRAGIPGRIVGEKRRRRSRAGGLRMALEELGVAWLVPALAGTVVEQPWPSSGKSGGVLRASGRRLKPRCA